MDEARYSVNMQSIGLYSTTTTTAPLILILTPESLYDMDLKTN